MEHKDESNIVAMLTELRDDKTVPKNVRSKIEKIISFLNDESEKDIRVSKALNELEEIADDVNLESYTRTQVWNVISGLEKTR